MPKPKSLPTREPATEALQRLGFTEYEARVYLALLRQQPLNGYEVAKAAGIPRANVYAVLSKLAERGVLLTLSGEAAPRYSPIPPEQLLERTQAAQREALQRTGEALAKVERAHSRDEVFSAHGYSALLEHAKSAIRGAKRELLVALMPSEAQALHAELSAAQDRGVSITILCLNGCPQDCGCCEGRAFRYRVAPATAARWFICVADDASLIAGQVSGADADALITAQRMLIELCAAYIRQSVALAAVLIDAGESLDERLTPETRAVLQAISPQAERTFLGYMNDLIRRQ